MIRPSSRKGSKGIHPRLEQYSSSLSHRPSWHPLRWHESGFGAKAVVSACFGSFGHVSHRIEAVNTYEPRNTLPLPRAHRCIWHTGLSESQSRKQRSWWLDVQGLQEEQYDSFTDEHGFGHCEHLSMAPTISAREPWLSGNDWVWSSLTAIAEVTLQFPWMLAAGHETHI